MITVKIKILAVVNPMTVTDIEEPVVISTEEIAASDKIIERSSVITVTKPQGKVTYTKKSGDDKITVDSKTGDITIPQGMAEGTYEIVINVKSAGNSKYKAATKTADVTIIVGNPESEDTE